MCRTTVTGSLAVWLPINRTPPPPNNINTHRVPLFVPTIDWLWTKTNTSVNHCAINSPLKGMTVCGCHQMFDFLKWVQKFQSLYTMHFLFIIQFWKSFSPLAAIWHIAKTSIDLTSVQQFRKPNKEMGNILN